MVSISPQTWYCTNLTARIQPVYIKQTRSSFTVAWHNMTLSFYLLV
jgi:hypothetical protein